MYVLFNIIKYVKEVEFTMLLFIFILFICISLSALVSCRTPLYYDIFLVEMHTWTQRRIVQVIHVGQELIEHFAWSRLLSRIRDRAPVVENDRRVAVSYTNIVVHSPNTMIHSPTSIRRLRADQISLWDIEMSRRVPGQEPNPLRDSQYAAAAAIAILARSDDSMNISETTSLYNHLPLVEEAANDETEISRVEETTADASDIATSVNSFSTIVVDGLTNSAESSTESSFNDQEEPEPVEELSRDEPSTSEENLQLLRLKFMNDTQIETFAQLSDTIGNYKKKNFPDVDPKEKVIRLIYQGQLLRDDNRTLESYGIKSGDVLHCHISSTPYSATGNSSISTTNTTNTSNEASTSNNNNNINETTAPRVRRRLRATDNEQNHQRNYNGIVSAINKYSHLVIGAGFTVLQLNRGVSGFNSIISAVLLILCHIMQDRLFYDAFVLDHNRRIRIPRGQLIKIFCVQITVVFLFYLFNAKLFQYELLALLLIMVLNFVHVMWVNETTAS